MLSICFGYPGRFTTPYLSPGSCHYSTLEIRRVQMNTERERVDEFIKLHDTSKYIGIAVHVRVPSFDTPDIMNGIAYTCIGLQFDTPKNNFYRWMLLRHNLESLQKLKEMDIFPIEFINYLELKIWENLGQFHTTVKTLIEKFLQKISVTLAEKYYQPDYLWRTGKNAGKTTIRMVIDTIQQHLNIEN